MNRHTMKGYTMKQMLGQAAAGVALMGAAIAGIASIDASDAPVKSTGYAQPIPCVVTVEQVLACGSPEASPVATETPEPTPTFTPRDVPTTVIDTIDTLPSTGTGNSR